MIAPSNALSSAEIGQRERLRADLFLAAVLPLLEVVMHEQPHLRQLVQGLSGTVQFEARNSDLAARIVFDGESLRVIHGPPEPSSLRFVFGHLGKMNEFFAGKPRFPRITPYFGIFQPRMTLQTLRLLMVLRILEPPRPHVPRLHIWGFRSPSAPSAPNPPPTPKEQALRVRLLLYLVTRALERLHRQGHGPMCSLAEDSPDRVYQWTVVGTDIAAWVRMHKGRVKSGRGTCAARRPFVHFVFPNVDAAFAVLTATSSQMQGFRGGNVVTYGSPEYTRKMALLMQDVDKLLLEG
jgi:hypothetical protein